MNSRKEKKVISKKEERNSSPKERRIPKGPAGTGIGKKLRRGGPKKNSWGKKGRNPIRKKAFGDLKETKEEPNGR